MLLRLLRSPGLLDTIATPDSYRPPWTASHRDVWEGVREPVRRYWIARGERYLEFEWPSLESMYSDYEHTGNRTRFEAVYHKRRQVTTTFVFAEAFENAGRFVPPLADAMNRMCDEPTWVLPAHTQHPIDLFSAETGNLLAWALYLFQDVPAIRDSATAARVRREVRARILEPYITRDDCWWMALNGEPAGNWTTWCTSNCLGTALLLETEATRRAQAVEKACASLDRFVEAYKEDGGCDEGPMYWNFAAGCLFDSLEMLSEASRGAFHAFREPGIGNIGAYIAKVHVHDLYFVNFADSPPQIPLDAALLYRFGVQVGDPHMQALGAHIHRLLDRYDPEDTLRLKIYRALATMPHAQALQTIEGPKAAPRENYLPRLQVAIARGESRTAHGLVLAAKGGHNDEQHNHNDIGNVIVYADGRPAVVDAGMKQYNRDTFNDRRYENWAVQSAYHNVPLVNGVMQESGVQFAGRNALFEASEQEACFDVDIAGAYPPAAGLVRWRRTARLDRTAERVVVTDEFQFAGAANRYEQRFLTHHPPRRVGSEVVLALHDTLTLVIRTESLPSRTTLHQIPLRDGHLRHAWGEALYQVRFHFDAVPARGRCEISLSARRGPHHTSSVAGPFEIEDLP